jgi:AraC-like DNA-binding protein
MDRFQIPQLFSDSPMQLTQSEDLTIIAYHQDQQIEKANVELDRNLIIMVTRGYKTVIGQQRQATINAGEGIFLSRGNYLLSEKFKNEEGYESWLIFFSDDFAHRFAAQHPKLTKKEANDLQLKSFSWNAEVTNYMDGLIRYARQSELLANPSFAALKVEELFWLLAQSSERQRFLSFLNRISVRPEYRIREIMEHHFRESLSLEQLAFLSGYSLASFKRHFKQEFETTPGEWIKQKRLEEARYLLRSSPKNVTEICHEVGFENLSHFVQEFKARFGITPKQFQLEQEAT